MRVLPNVWGENCDVSTEDSEPVTPEFDDTQLLAWAAGNAYQITSAEYDDTGVITVADILWPDGSTGSYTRTVKNTGCNAVDGYVLTHDSSAGTVTQPTITRDGFCNVLLKPALVVSGYTPASPTTPTLGTGTIVDITTVAVVNSSVITAEFISLAQDANGQPGMFVRDEGSVAADDGVNVIVDANGTRFLRRSHQ